MDPTISAPFITDSVDLSVTLCIKGYEPALHTDDSRHVWFTFPDSPKLREIVTAYTLGRCLVEPQAYGRQRAGLVHRMRDLTRARK
jgi:(2Fe-2S) ferredoxin